MPSFSSSLLQADMRVLLDDFERGARRREEELVLAGAEPERPSDAARGEDRAGLALVEPRRRHRAEERLERRRLVPRMGGEREDRLGVDRHPRLGAGALELGEELVVVDDDPVVDPDHRAVPDGMVVGRDRRVALRVVAHVDEELGGRVGHVDALEKLARGRPLLRHDRIRIARGRGGRTRPRRLPARRSRPAAPARQASDRRRYGARGYIRRFRTRLGSSNTVAEPFGGSVLKPP